LKIEYLKDGAPPRTEIAGPAMPTRRGAFQQDSLGKIEKG
jgi:hypothetical protein